MAAASTKMLTASQVAERICVSPATLDRMVASGRFPAPIVIGAVRAKGRIRRWREVTVNDWIEREDTQEQKAAKARR